MLEHHRIFRILWTWKLLHGAWQSSLSLIVLIRMFFVLLLSRKVNHLNFATNRAASCSFSSLWLSCILTHCVVCALCVCLPCVPMCTGTYMCAKVNALVSAGAWSRYLIIGTAQVNLFLLPPSSNDRQRRCQPHPNHDASSLQYCLMNC
jgi:hypothetical protein